MPHTKLLLVTILISSFNICIAQENNPNEIDVQAINNQPIASSYSNDLNIQRKKPIFSYTQSKTQIDEYKEYGHSKRDINIKSNLGTYSLSKPLNGAINDEKSNRTTSVPVFKF